MTVKRGATDKTNPVELSSPWTCSHASQRARLHPCPFQIDVAGNDDPKFCRCCAACENNCLTDI